MSMYGEPDIVRRENINIPSLGVSDYSIEFRRLEIEQTKKNLQYLLCFYDKKHKQSSVVLLREIQHYLKEVEIGIQTLVDYLHKIKSDFIPDIGRRRQLTEQERKDIRKRFTSKEEKELFDALELYFNQLEAVDSCLSFCNLNKHNKIEALVVESLKKQLSLGENKIIFHKQLQQKIKKRKKLGILMDLNLSFK